ncbi:MAG TPA: SlyX family protein [Opitutaceae bacterium]|jgi:SlyX protein|nr:SlyX family protein [Opitutaceae bacterium]
MSDDPLERLEARFTWLERHVIEQDRAMSEMAEELRRLRREAEALRDRLRTAAAAEEPGDGPEPPPPHY